jgi:hypothetical protein
LTAFRAVDVTVELVGVGVGERADRVTLRVGDDVGLHASNEGVVPSENAHLTSARLDLVGDRDPVAVRDRDDLGAQGDAVVVIGEGADDPLVLILVRKARDDRLGHLQRRVSIGGA